MIRAALVVGVCTSSASAADADGFAITKADRTRHWHDGLYGGEFEKHHTKSAARLLVESIATTLTGVVHMPFLLVGIPHVLQIV